jgi:serine/threonine protein phosphatase PrpC
MVYRPKAGQSRSGDGYLVAELDGMCLVAVADGLGSGDEAAQAARLALATVGQYMWSNLSEVLQACHQALNRSRGAVMGLLRIKFESRQASYAGVGNVDMRSLSASGFHPINAYGIVGSRFPVVRVFEGTYTPGDVFVLSTDGITRRFSLDKLPAVRGRPPQDVADQIAAEYGTSADDVTVVVVA